MISVLIADDPALIRDGLRLILDSQHDIEVVGEAADGIEAVRLASELKPDVVLMDVRMPVLDGLAATARITARTRCRVVVLTTFDLDEYVVEALRGGATGFLLKSSPRQHLLHAVRTAVDGGALLDPRLTLRLMEQHLRSHNMRPVDAAKRLGRLTMREQQVLKLVARGLSNAEIAASLHLGETTVKSHVAHTLGKLEVRDRIHAVVFCYEAGVVDAAAGDEPVKPRPDCP